MVWKKKTVANNILYIPIRGIYKNINMYNVYNMGTTAAALEHDLWSQVLVI